MIDSCSGHILLAFAEDEDREEMLQPIPSGLRKPSKSALKRIVERIRSDGFERSPSAQIHGVQDIGYPVFDHAGRIAAALVVPFLEFLDDSHPVKIDAAQTVIEKTAKHITAGLGH